MRWIAGLAFVFCGLSAANADLLSYHFDTDNQDWSRGDFDVNHLVLNDVGAATWNAGGYIDAPDFASWSFHVSPWLVGDFSSASAIEFDYSSDASDGPYPFVVLGSMAGALYQTTAVPADGQFHHYSYALTVGTWQFSDGVNFRVATATDMLAVLGDLHQIGINADQQTGADYTRLDNVVLVPEPASMLGLSIGILAFARRRKTRV